MRTQPTITQQQALTLLENWATQGLLRELDLALVRFLQAEVPAMEPALMLATALTSYQLGQGHVCLDLQQVLGNPAATLALSLDKNNPTLMADVQYLKEQLAAWQAADWHIAPQQAKLINHGAGNTPLVLVKQRLYLRRYWRYERQIETAIQQRLLSSQQLLDHPSAAEFREKLDALFPPAPLTTQQANTTTTDWQKIAGALAAHSNFSLITGGPGTGKTTTVVRLLALLQSNALAENPTRPLTIRLAAPTGKAAARLQEAITDAIDKLPAFVQANSLLQAHIPNTVTTLHRLLGARPNTRLFRHHARNPLLLDVLVIDEGSMIDLEMMASVLLALPTHARLIILGDKDQLASVEAGSVLGALCQRAHQGHFLPETIRWIEATTGEHIDPALQDANGLPLDQHIVMLRTSRRFTDDSGIGQLAQAVNSGDLQTIAAIWQQDFHDLYRYDLPDLTDKRLQAILFGQMPQQNHPPGIIDYLHIIKTAHPPLEADKAAFDAWAQQILQTHSHFQLLCVLRDGPFGVSGLNHHIETLLANQQMIQPDGIWYEGRPILITRNDYALGLMNGDIGITLSYPTYNQATNTLEWGLRVAFIREDGSDTIRWIAPSRLQNSETVFALTVHKSQGSEFEHCTLLLPSEPNPILTRELIYTGITRGKRWLSLICVGNHNIINQAVTHTVQRSGGLFAENSHTTTDY